MWKNEKSVLKYYGNFLFVMRRNIDHKNQRQNRERTLYFRRGIGPYSFADSPLCHQTSRRRLSDAITSEGFDAVASTVRRHLAENSHRCPILHTQYSLNFSVWYCTCLILKLYILTLQLESIADFQSHFELM